MRVCHISTFPPTQCGIAAYAQSLIEHQSTILPIKIRLHHEDDRPSCVSDITIRIQQFTDYTQAAARLNEYGPRLVCLQHEFGIYGGLDGCYVLELARQLRVPLVTTFHTISGRMSQEKRLIIRELAERSSTSVVLSSESRDVLVSMSVPISKVTVIDHGIPEVEFIRPEEAKLRRRFGSGLVLISPGHVKPKKGYPISLAALSLLRQVSADFTYLIVGTNQPQFHQYDHYEETLRELIRKQGLEKNVVRVNEYPPLESLIDMIQAADIGLLTYTATEQNSSGILPLILGCGRPVVSTAFEHARSISARVPGIFLARDADSAAVYECICKFIQNRDPVNSLMLPTYDSTRNWTWPSAANQYLRVFQRSCLAS